MKRYIPIITAVTLLVVAVITGMPTSSPAIVYTPPGPGSTNPAVQPDGILVPDVFGSTPNWNLTPPLRKFIDTLAPLGCTTPNNLGQCIPVAVPDKRTFPGSDYYEIEVRRFTEKVHTDLPNSTTLQGYVQVNNGTNQAGTANTVAPAPIHYLGPLIVAQKGRPVRIKFVNKLPLQNVEPFFLPVDESVMGSGQGSKNADGSFCDPVWDPRGRNGLPTTEPNCAKYPQNRAELHLHGGLNPWISDGTPHQWITPAGEATPYKKGDSVQYVPDMWFDASGNVIAACAGQNTCGAAGATNNPGAGAQTYYYTNEQSARLMFYHDHSYGITRLNVYAGEAAGYLIQDPTEADLVTRGIIPADQIPLVIQDKNFVDAGTIETLDPTWVWGTGAAKPNRWVDALGVDIASCAGQATCATPGARKIIGRTPKTGDLWWPHVYMPAENPADLGGVNPLGRWVYGMYFWPPTTEIKFLPVPNPYYDCDPLGVCNAPWEPANMPATPNPSWVAEAFVDTPMVNGTVYPTLAVQPKAYRLRILNAAHDRFFNLQLYQADTTVDPNVVNAAACAALGGCATNTEVRMVPAIQYPAFPLWDAAADQRAGGVPDPATAGPAWIQIGNEGGFLPTPVVIPNQPISFVLDPTLFNVGNVNDGTVILGPAERADVIIDFSQYAGKTLILYNDAPAAFPAFVPNNDYYTDAPDASGSGGHPGPKAGIGPNTRTIMQIKVAATTPAAPFNLTALMDEFTTTATKDGVFKKGQHPPIVGQTAYDSAFNTTFPSVAPYWGISGIADQKLSFQTLNPTTLAPETVSLYPMQPKALHDEMGAVWDEYGRMSAKLGLELPNTNNINQIFVMQNYVDPPTELMQDGKVQIWKMTHNGVDTHPLHFHLFDVQVINRVGWDGFVRLPWPNELGWKDTVRTSPLEDTIVAMRPKAPPVPFAMPDSQRLKNPTYPDSAAVTDGFMNLDPLTGQAKIPADNNAGLFNYGAEYVWHCHILSHEEQDMMRAIVLRSATAKPADPTGLTITAGFQKNTLDWTDNSFEVTAAPYNTTIGFFIERCTGNGAACNAGAGTFTRIAEMTLLPTATPSYIDTQIAPNTTYTYRVRAYNRYVDNTTFPVTWHDGITDPLARSAALYGTQTSLTWSGATGVTLTPDFASPHAGPVKFVALGSGATVPYQYRFRLNNGTTTTTVQDYSATRFWVLPAVTTAGTYNYTVTVDVRTNFASATPDSSVSVAYNLLPTLDTTPPVTTAIPAAGAFLNPVQVYLQANEPGSVIKYTIDGSDPTTSATAVIYTAPVSISATTTLKYFATDPAGNPETVQSGIYELRPGNLNATISINNGAAVTNTTAVTLTLAATGATMVSFSNDNITYTPEETFLTSKPWTLAPATPDGLRTVYVRLRDTSGILQSPIAAHITLDTTKPVTTPNPVAGTFIAQLNVTLTPSEAGSTIRYTIDGSDPTTSATALVYTGPIAIAATTAIKYYAIDPAGNAEAVNTGIYTIHTSDLTVNTLKINGGAAITNSSAVTITIDAIDATGVLKMRFSNDGITYSADEPYATSKAWNLSAGDGVKSVFVRFTDGAGILYDPVTTQITLDTTAPVTTAIPAPGVFTNPMNVYLTVNEPGSIIKYTIDGSDPTTSLTAAVYSLPINISAVTTLKYYSVDPAGNVEAVNTGIYQVTTSGSLTSVTINGGATVTNNTAVTLTISATGMTLMRFSNDGVNYSANEAYATSKAWTLTPGDGVKTVFVNFIDGAGNVVGPVVAQITLNTTAPLTTATPAAGTFVAPVTVTLSASDVNSTIKYTIDGSDPTTSATAATYSVPITISTSTTLKYFATNPAGNTEPVKTGLYVIHTTLDLTVNAFTINGGATTSNSTAVILTIDATDPLGVAKMRFSNDGVSYSADEPYATSKAWTLAAGDGVKNVYVRFTDGAGILYDPAAAQITLDTTAPTTTANPASGTFIAPISATLSSNDASSTIKYTIDGSDPATSATAITYNGPINIAATTTLKYFATDAVGNAETVKSNTYTIHTADLVVSLFTINNGASVTNSTAVTLTLAASDATGVVKMRFSNDGVNYSADEPYATSKAWAIGTGDGVKNVYVRITDGAGILYDPVMAQITLDTAAPVTSASPIPGTYIVSPIQVSLTANKPATIYYTTDGSTPTTASAVYNGPISLTATTTVKYFAVDTFGNIETVKTGTWMAHVTDMVSNVQINNGASGTNTTAVTLTLSATDPLGVVKMQFSNDGVNFTAEENYATSKAWTLAPGDGLKTVYVRFRDGALPAGNLYDPVTAQITLSTTAPITTASPIPGTYAAASIAVTLSTSKPATIYYTTDGSTPTTASAVYSAPISLTATSTVRYFAVDATGNTEAVNSGTWTIHVVDMVSSVKINNGASTTNTTAVTLTLSATDPLGVTKMQFSNDGVNFTAEENYATSKAWTLAAGDGPKTVYVRFRDGALPTGNLYEPVTASITLSTTSTPDGKLTGNATLGIGDALRALQIAVGLIAPTASDMAHGDVAPLVNGKPAPDGIIDSRDALVILRAVAGLITLQ